MRITTITALLLLLIVVLLPQQADPRLLLAETVERSVLDARAKMFTGHIKTPGLADAVCKAADLKAAINGRQSTVPVLIAAVKTSIAKAVDELDTLQPSPDLRNDILLKLMPAAEALEKLSPTNPVAGLAKNMVGTRASSAIRSWRCRDLKGKDVDMSMCRQNRRGYTVEATK